MERSVQLGLSSQIVGLRRSVDGKYRLQGNSLRIERRLRGIIVRELNLGIRPDRRTHRSRSEVGGGQMIGYIHLQIYVGDLLILNIDLRYLQRGVKLWIVKGAGAVGF